MAEELFNFYKNELGIYNMVFKHMKILYWSSIILPIIIFLSMIGLKVFKLITNTDLCKSMFVFAIIYIIFMFTIVNRVIKNITVKFYKKKSKKFMWYSDYNVIKAIKNKEILRMSKYLKRNQLFRKTECGRTLQQDKIKILLEDIEALKNELKHTHYKGFIMPSIFGALFISVWNNFFSWVYSKNTINVSQAINILIYTCLLLITFAGFYMILKIIYNIVVEDILNRDYRKICECESLLKEIYNNYKRKGKCQN